MTEKEVLEKSAAFEFGNGASSIVFGDGDDQEMWTIYEIDGERRAHLMWPSARQQRLERPPMQWEVDGILERGSVTETLLSESPYGTLPDKLPKAIKWLQGYLDKVPAKLRSKARIRFDTHMEYGDTYPRIEITYERPETDEEWTARRADLDERIAHHREKARKEFERLKGQFEPDAHNAQVERNG